MTAAVAELELRPNATKAPLGRLLRAELRWILFRRRTVFALIGLALLPVVIGIGMSFAVNSGGVGGGITALIDNNGMALPLLNMIFMITLMLPLVASMYSADAIAGESAHGTLRGLLVAPVSRVRLLGMKSFGVGVAVLISVVLTTIVALITGLILFGGTSGMLTFSGTTISFGAGLARLGLLVLWATFEILAVAAVALAISTFTDHPLVVMASTLAGIIVFSVLGNIPQLSAIHPLLITTGFTNGAASFAGDPLDYTVIGNSVLVALCYLVIGMSIATARIINPR